MKFFIPGTNGKDSELAYEQLIASVKDQMRWPISERRLYRLEYIHDKRRYVLQVGEIEPQSKNYVVCAILDSNSYVVLTRDRRGLPGIRILVNKEEVTSEEEFK